MTLSDPVNARNAIAQCKTDLLLGIATHRQRVVMRSILESKTNECLPWPHNKTKKGYGIMRVNGVRRHVHRLVCEVIHGPPPTDKHYACHAPKVCHNRLCCNPRHLRWATPTENVLDKRIDGTDNRGGKNPQAKITEKQAVQILKDTRLQRVIAAEYGLSESYISSIKTGKKWAHLQKPAS